METLIFEACIIVRINKLQKWVKIKYKQTGRQESREEDAKCSYHVLHAFLDVCPSVNQKLATNLKWSEEWPNFRKICKLVFTFPWFLSETAVLNFLIQFSSVALLCLTLCDPIDCSMPGLPVHHQLLEFTQTRVRQVSDAIQPSNSLLSPSPTAFNLSQHQDLFQWVGSLHQVAKVLEFQL